jgi:hypothetical protein
LGVTETKKNDPICCYIAKGSQGKFSLSLSRHFRSWKRSFKMTTFKKQF